MVGILVATRVVFWFFYAFLVLRDMPLLRHSVTIDPRLLPMLFSFGAWMTVSNILSPIMEYMDRFLVGMLLSLTAIAYYATPFGVATKMLILSHGYFWYCCFSPRFLRHLWRDREHAGRLFRRAVKYVALALLPITFLMVLFAQNGLNFWLGPVFASHGAQRTAVACNRRVFFNGIATLPFALLQGAGRAGYHRA